MTYSAFIASKHRATPAQGLPAASGCTSGRGLHPWQGAVVEWALRRGRAALFEECGLGKTPQQLVWAMEVANYTGRPVLILAPLAVAAQTVREAEKFGMGGDVSQCRSQEDVDQGWRRPRVAVANYERLARFDPSRFSGVVLDESSILKNYTGKTKQALIRAFARTPFRLCCTATPAPNDTVELGNHSEFLGVMSSGDMLTRFFINDTRQANTLRLKGHAVRPFWRWVSTWAACVSKPSDVGGDDTGYVLPPLHTAQHVVDAGGHDFSAGTLISMPRSLSAADLHREMAATVQARAERAADLATGQHGAEPVILWVNTNAEADAVLARVPGAEEVRGDMSLERKERTLEEFSAGNLRVLVTKPGIAGWGLNWQHCAASVSVGLSYSFEQRYQALRRLWRFGQAREVRDHVVMAPGEAQVYAAVAAKAERHADMARNMAGLVNTREALRGAGLELEPYQPGEAMRLPAWLREVAA